MSYIGNAKTPLLLATNVRDDLVPNGTNTFTLSQEVPGGYEGNVVVVRRRFLTDIIVENTNLIQISGPVSNEYTVTITDNYLAAAFSVVQEGGALTDDGDWLEIVYNGTTSFNKVTSVSYDRDNVTLKLRSYNTNPQPVSSGNTIQKISRKYFGAWEILDAEKQYAIVSEGVYVNQKIQIKDFVPVTDDQIYVLHRGEATYNFVPSPASVGPDQLSPNLRNFAVTHETYTSLPSSLVIELDGQASNDKSLIVTINGIVAPGASEYLSDPTNAPWTLSQDGKQITLNSSLFSGVSVSNPLKVRILNLSFSTVSRRHTFAPGQGVAEIADNSVTSLKLSVDSVTTSKISNNSVSGAKILLDNNQALRSKKQDGNELNILSLDASNSTIITGDSSVGIDLGSPSQRALSITSSENSILPGQNNTWSFGSNSVRLKEIHSTAASIQTLSANSVSSQTVVASGTVTGTNITALGNEITSIKAALEQIKSELVPVGTILLWSNSTAPVGTTYGGTWIVCDGSLLNKSDYPDLYAALGGNSLPTWPWGARTATQFTIPDLRKRVPVGNVDATSFGSSENLSSVADRHLTHSHTGVPHTHVITHNHTVPAHKHSYGTTSNLKINSSGAHNTDISHEHPSSSVQIDNSGPLVHRHEYSHSHNNITTDDGGKDHTHTGTTNGGSQHRHSARINRVLFPDRPAGFGRGYANGNYSLPFSNMQIIYQDDAQSDADLLRVENAHTHTFKTNAASEHLHTHTFTIQPSTNTTSEPKANSAPEPNNLIHRHGGKVTNTTLSASGGEHEHSHSDFASEGYIGPNAAGTPDGNSDIQTKAPEGPMVSGGADYGTSKTNDVTIPHITINFIIKAKSL